MVALAPKLGRQPSSSLQLPFFGNDTFPSIKFNFVVYPTNSEHGHATRIRRCRAARVDEAGECEADSDVGCWVAEGVFDRSPSRSAVSQPQVDPA